ncbi:hypothetical protein DSECCO2_533210 [anaerobic digester metagenome]
MWITFQQGTIHERAGVTLVTIADDVLFVFISIVYHLPLDVSGETAAATSAQAGFLDYIDHILWFHLGQHCAQSFITAGGDVFIQAFGIDVTAILQSHFHLFLVKGHVFLCSDGLFFILQH